MCLSACALQVRFSLSRTIFMPFSFQLTSASLLSYNSDTPGFQEGLQARGSFHFLCTHTILCKPIVSTVHACVLSHSVCPALLKPRGLYSARFLYPWNFQARILEWVAISYSWDLPDPGIEPMSLGSPALAGGFFPTIPSGKPVFSTRWL